MKKQTAIEWLVSQLNKEGFAQVVTNDEIEQALEMEKQQHEESFRQSLMSNYQTFEQYYKETCGK